jgi:peptide/nickel transport system permease protein
MGASSMSTGRKIRIFFKRYGRLVLGGGMLLIIVILALLAPVLAPHDPNAIDVYRQKQFPSELHPMGTDTYGRDIYSRLLFGARVSLLVGLGVGLVSLVLGVILGLLMGYYPKFDKIGMRVLEGISSFPELLFALVLASILGPGVDKIIVALAIVSTPGVARIVRSQVLSLKQREFVEGALAAGASDFRILFRYILPLCTSPLIIRFTATIASAILTEASLSFLGVGIPPTIPTWGGLHSEAKAYVVAYPFMAIFPGIAIALTVLSISILGDGLRDVLDPKLR